MVPARGIVDSRYNFAVLASPAQDRIVSRWLQDRAPVAEDAGQDADERGAT